MGGEKNAGKRKKYPYPPIIQQVKHCYFILHIFRKSAEKSGSLLDVPVIFFDFIKRKGENSRKNVYLLPRAVDIKMNATQTQWIRLGGLIFLNELING